MMAIGKSLYKLKNSTLELIGSPDTMLEGDIIMMGKNEDGEYRVNTKVISTKPEVTVTVYQPPKTVLLRHTLTNFEMARTPEKAIQNIQVFRYKANQYFAFLVTDVFVSKQDGKPEYLNQFLVCQIMNRFLNSCPKSTTY